MKHHYPHDRSAVRPYRLWDIAAERNVPRRYYTHLHNALHGALRVIYDSPQMLQLQVYNVHTARELAIFHRSAGRILFNRSLNGKESNNAKKT
jgi:hypothetical protein